MLLSDLPVNTRFTDPADGDVYTVDRHCSDGTIIACDAHGNYYVMPDHCVDRTT